MTPCDWAFKEWAVVVDAIRSGRQSIVLRKGGIAERAGDTGTRDRVFRVEQDRFWLFPTCEHQRESDLKTEAHAALRRIVGEPHVARSSSATTISIDTLVDVEHHWYVDDIERLHMLDALHVWSREAVEKRFAYRDTPGLYVIAIRARRLAAPIVIDNLTRYAGCRSWVQLETALSLGDSPGSPVDPSAVDAVSRLLDRA